MKCNIMISIDGLETKACRTMPSMPLTCSMALNPLVSSFTAASTKSRSTLPLDNTSSVGRNAPGVLPVEGIPAATKVNFV